MANLIKSILIIRGNEVDRKEFIDSIRKTADDGSVVYDPCSLLPCPEELLSFNWHGLTLWGKIKNWKRKKDYVRRFGTFSWTWWRHVNWGTEMVYDVEMHDNGVLTYVTKLTPASGLIRGISKRFPKLIFETLSMDECKSVGEKESFCNARQIAEESCCINNNASLFNYIESEVDKYFESK